MEISIGIGSTVDEVVRATQEAADDSSRSGRLSNLLGLDAITAIAGRAIPDLRLGTAVVPTFPRPLLEKRQPRLTGT
jgi:hypothetical protein